ncbi:hypothetical protein HYH03_002108 [Edaphochlamys debaryana]|uniref:Glycosyltransferase n=1 Tax=Edaphochlamys debaryana TaxID=47281 RepID=A0A835YBC0_9CHLO|nr:hypothetical protein HYH03_002108 [Edaphochlamys debaryana]|eukprot:KAG2499815.1 hypothetical protein HYH03_002108 [Edaphochlamys debaryana]
MLRRRPLTCGHAQRLTRAGPLVLTLVLAALLSPCGRLVAGASARSDEAAAPGPLAAPLRVTVYNDVPSHWEVFAGAVETARRFLGDPTPHLVWAAGDHDTEPHPLLNVMGWVGGPAWAWHRVSLAGCGKDCGPALAADLTWGPVDVLVCVSPEMDERHQGCLHSARALSAGLVVAVLHRADQLPPRPWFLQDPPGPDQVQVQAQAQAPGAHVPVHMLALAPHVAAAVSAKVGRAHRLDWALLAGAYAPERPCASTRCLRGFTVQGTLRYWSGHAGSGLIRDYVGLWAQLAARADAAAVNVTVLGKGGHLRNLGVPPELSRRVTLRSGLPYPEFWLTIHTSWALVPAFGTDQYLTSRISSTMLASLTACVPIIASRAILDVYTFLGEEHVFLQGEGEAEVDVMVRVLALDEAAVLAKRAAVCRLREEMGRRAAAVVRGALEVAGQPMPPLPPAPPGPPGHPVKRKGSSSGKGSSRRTRSSGGSKSRGHG